MSDKPDNQPAETEKGFGTGLRAQLQRRQDGGEGQVEAAAPTNVELRFELTARPAGESEAIVINAEVAALEAELEAAHTREQKLRDELDKKGEAFEQGFGSEQEL